MGTSRGSPGAALGPLGASRANPLDVLKEILKKNKKIDVEKGSPKTTPATSIPSVEAKIDVETRKTKCKPKSSTPSREVKSELGSRRKQMAQTLRLSMFQRFRRLSGNQIQSEEKSI